MLRGSISLGGIQKVLDRVTLTIDPYYTVIAQQARQAPVSYIDETLRYCLNALEWLWVMASELVAFYMIHPRRSKEAFAALSDDWARLLEGHPACGIAARASPSVPGGADGRGTRACPGG